MHLGVADFDRLRNHPLHQLLEHLEPQVGFEVRGPHILAAQSRLIDGEIEATVDLKGGLRLDHVL